LKKAYLKILIISAVCIHTFTANGAEVVHAVGHSAARNISKPVRGLCEILGIQGILSDAGETLSEETASNGLLFSGTADLFDSQTTFERSKSVERLMDRALERGLVARMFNFKEGQALPSIGAIGLPFMVGKAVQVFISLVPGGGIVADIAGRGVGKATQWALRKKTDINNDAFESNDALTLQVVQQLAEEISQGFVQRYATTLSQMSEQQVKDMVHYGSISLLDHIDQLFNTAKDGDSFSVYGVATVIISNMANRYLKIDHIVPTISTMGRAAGRGIKMKKGFGAGTVGDIMTTPLVRQGNAFYLDPTALQTERVDNKKKRGHVKAKRKLSSKVFAVRDAMPNDDLSNYKKITEKEVDKITSKARAKKRSASRKAAPAA